MSVRLHAPIMTAIMTELSRFLPICRRSHKPSGSCKDRCLNNICLSKTFDFLRLPPLTAALRCTNLCIDSVRETRMLGETGSA
jgi:hypothetical protein